MKSRQAEPSRSTAVVTPGPPARAEVRASAPGKSPRLHSAPSPHSSCPWASSWLQLAAGNRRRDERSCTVTSPRLVVESSWILPGSHAAVVAKKGAEEVAALGFVAIKPPAPCDWRCSARLHEARRRGGLAGCQTAVLSCGALVGAGAREGRCLHLVGAVPAEQSFISDSQVSLFKD